MCVRVDVLLNVKTVRDFNLGLILRLLLLMIALVVLLALLRL